jgi:hypothetical protein
MVSFLRERNNLIVTRTVISVYRSPGPVSTLCGVQGEATCPEAFLKTDTDAVVELSVYDRCQSVQSSLAKMKGY